MNHTYRIGTAAAAAVLLLLGGCAPATVAVSTRATDYNGKPARMYVVGTTGMGWNNDFSLAFAAKFRELAKQCGVEAAYDELSGLELDSSALTNKMRGFRADSILTIANGGGVIGAYGNRMSINYGTTLTDAMQNRAVWKGKYSFSRGAQAIPIEERAAVLAIDITNSLKKDGFLSGCGQVALGQNGRLDPSAVPVIAHGTPVSAASPAAAPAPAASQG
ncbi:hypothetical protein, partial [Cupriavidus sp. M-11]